MSRRSFKSSTKKQSFDSRRKKIQSNRRQKRQSAHMQRRLKGNISESMTDSDGDIQMQDKEKPSIKIKKDDYVSVQLERGTAIARIKEYIDSRHPIKIS